MEYMLQTRIKTVKKILLKELYQLQTRQFQMLMQILSVYM